MRAFFSSIVIESNGSDLRYRFSNRELFRTICGVADAGIAHLEELLSVKLIPRGHSFLIHSDQSDRVDFARLYFDALSRQYSRNGDRLPEHFDTHYLYRLLKQEQTDAAALAANAEEGDPTAYVRQKIFTNYRGRPIHARTRRQAEFFRSMMDNAITVCIGPAGTGKTFLSVASACRMMFEGDMERVILTRPAVEAGESLGYLPGDLTQKVDPYLRPLYDALYECIGFEKVGDFLSTRKIEVAPLAFMRGRTLNDSIAILDEAQNCTIAQLKMFLTRLGRNSRMCLSGDITQIDLTPGRSGLLKVARMLEGMEGVGIIRFGREDIIRNPMVEKIVRVFEENVPDEDRAPGDPAQGEVSS